VKVARQPEMADTGRWRPLAERMRPATLAEFAGQEHLLAPGKPLREAIERGAPHSMILWGPPGSGKTTLARLVAASGGARFLSFSAVLAGVKDIRAAVGQALEGRAAGQSSVLFVDEVHRFNKAQQDGFLPYVEDGTLMLIGATTENPSFELNKALLSRARVYVLKALEPADIRRTLERALADRERGLGALELEIVPELLEVLARAADGDVRRGLNLLEQAADLAVTRDGNRVVEEGTLRELVTGGTRRFDKGGEAFYDQISALHKSVRGSDPDAALYWLARMLDGGGDPLYVARRVVRMASEDIGLADPRAVAQALDAWDVQERLGSPEGELAIAEAVVYLACAPKSNAVYAAFSAALDDARSHGSLEVPLHLRNAPTRLMKELGYGRDYRYAHDEPGAYAAGESYLPEKLGRRRYYRPTDRGIEARIAERLAELRARDRRAGSGRDEE